MVQLTGGVAYKIQTQQTRQTDNANSTAQSTATTRCIVDPKDSNYNYSVVVRALGTTARITSRASTQNRQTNFTSPTRNSALRVTQK